MNKIIKVIVTVIVIGLISGLGYTINIVNNKDKEIKKISKEYDSLVAEIEAAEEEEEEVTAPEQAEYTFTSGKYIAGTDFAEGTYDIISQGGTGTVNTPTSYITFGYNAADGNEFKNASFADGEGLIISGLKIKLIRK